MCWSCCSGATHLRASSEGFVSRPPTPLSVPRRSQVQQKFCFNSTRQMVPHPSCQPFFSYSSVWYRSVTFFHLSKFRTCMSLLCFPCRLISCFSLPVDKWYLRRSVLTINQSLIFLFEAFLFLLLSSSFDVIPAWFGWRPTKLIVCSEHSVSFPTSTCHLIYSPSQTPSVQLFALNANPILELESIPVACLFPTSFPSP